MIKLDKQLFFIQLLTIIPLSLFLLIYTQYYIISVIPILFIVYNIYRALQKLSLSQYPSLLMILIISFLVYAFYELGSKETPQTFEQFDTHNSHASFNLGKVTQIDKVCFYTGIDNNSKFTLNYLDDTKPSHFKPLFHYNKNFPFSFKWQCKDVDIHTSKINLEIIDGSLMMGEIRFLYNDLIHDDLVIDIQTDNTHLNDELNAIVDTSYFEGMFFDEIYHARTAYEMIHGLPLYDAAHPNLGKLLITPGIKAFGMTPFGWRVMNVLFGALFIIVFYYFALQLFKNELSAFSSALLITYSFMHFTQARIGLIDTFGVFFVFVSCYFLYRFIIKQQLTPLIISGVFFGLAAATKWSAVFASMGFLLISLYMLATKYPLTPRFSGYKLLIYGGLSYAVLAFSVYLLSFYNLYLETGSLKAIYWHQLHIYNYHSMLQAIHAYSSDWWSWPLNMKPMAYYREVKDGLFSSITVFGNPAIFWMGIVAIFYLIYIVIRKATLEAVFILLLFLALYLPYMFIGRLMFIYHFYYALPFMILAIVYFWNDLIHYSAKFYWALYAYLIVVIALFLLFYPVLSGYKVPISYVTDYLVWFKGWRF